MKLRIAFVPIARTTFDIPFAREKAALARAQLLAAGYDVLGPDDLVVDADMAAAVAQMLGGETVDCVVLFQATFADSTMAVKLAEASSAPLLLWAVPEPHTGGRLRLNSFCGINLAAHAYTRLGICRPSEHRGQRKHLNNRTNLQDIVNGRKSGVRRPLIRPRRLGR